MANNAHPTLQDMPTSEELHDFLTRTSLERPHREAYGFENQALIECNFTDLDVEVIDPEDDPHLFTAPNFFERVEDFKKMCLFHKAIFGNTIKGDDPFLVCGGYWVSKKEPMTLPLEEEENETATHPVPDLPIEKIVEICEWAIASDLNPPKTARAITRTCKALYAEFKGEVNMQAPFLKILRDSPFPVSLRRMMHLYTQRGFRKWWKKPYFLKLQLIEWDFVIRDDYGGNCLVYAQEPPKKPYSLFAYHQSVKALEETLTQLEVQMNATNLLLNRVKDLETVVNKRRKLLYDENWKDLVKDQ